MTSAEDSIIDELYFVTGLTALEQSLSQPREDILTVLFDLYKKEWVTLMINEERITGCNWEEFISEADNAMFLATKKGLFAHNSR